MSTFVFDACAIIAYMRNESGADLVEALLADDTNERLIHAINLCEVFYDSIRRNGENSATRELDILKRIGLVEIANISASAWMEAARLKARFRKVSLADCFAMVLTQETHGELITADRKELQAMREAGICRIRFVR